MESGQGLDGPVHGRGQARIQSIQGCLDLAALNDWRGQCDAIELADRLGKSRRVRQSIIRHAFRFFLGRNERLSDSKTLIDAEQAYVSSGGSFDAVIISLLTSDSFIYRKAIPDAKDRLGKRD